MAGGARMIGRAGTIALAAMLAASCGAGPGGDVPIGDATRGAFEARLLQNGELRAVKTENVTSSTWGKVSDVVREGAEVKAGDPVVWIETQEVEQQLKQHAFELEVAKTSLKKAEEAERLHGLEARLSREEAQAQLAFREVALARTEDDLKRKQRLAEEGLLSKSDRQAAESLVFEAELNRESAKVAVDRAKEDATSKGKTTGYDLDNARANLEKAEKQYGNAKERIENAVVRAPKGGIVVYKKNWRGEKLKAGDQVWEGAPLVEIPDLAQMEALLKVNEVDISRVEEGQRALLQVEAVPGLALTGKVASVAGLAQELPGAKEGEPSGIRAFEVVVSIDQSDPRLKPGMTVVASLVTEQAKDVVMVPRIAVFDREGRTVAFVKKTLGFEERAIQVGAENERAMIVLSGIEAGERVALLDPEGAGRPAPAAPREAAPDTSAAAPPAGGRRAPPAAVSAEVKP